MRLRDAAGPPCEPGQSVDALFLVPKAASCEFRDAGNPGSRDDVCLGKKRSLQVAAPWNWIASLKLRHTRARHLVVDDDVVLLVQSFGKMRSVRVGRRRRRVAEELPHRFRVARHAAVGPAHGRPAPVERPPRLAEAYAAVISDCSFVVLQLRDFPKTIRARPGRLRDARAPIP